MGSTEIMLGKIKDIKFGQNDDYQFGLHITFSSEMYGVQDSKWVHDYTKPPSKHSHWTVESRNQEVIIIMKFIANILSEAKVNYISELKDKPVEITLSDNMLVSWRILKEVL